MGDKISIAEARARRTDPVWRRLHKTADVAAAALVALVILAPAVVQILFPPFGAVLAVAVLLGAGAAVAGSGPKMGFERRTALLLGIPIVNLLILVPAVWRGAHLHLQRWRGPLEPRLDDQLWLAASVVGGLCWIATLGGAALLVATLS